MSINAEQWKRFVTWAQAMDRKMETMKQEQMHERLRLTDEDRRFLKSLHVAVED